MWSYIALIVISLSFCTGRKKYVLEKSSWYQRQEDTVPEETRVKMVNVSTALVKEAMLKLRQVAAIRDAHADKEGFGVGMVLGNIREKYRRMLETYREVRDKHIDRSHFVPPAVWGSRSYIFLLAMEHVHMLEVDIDKMVHILEAMPNTDLNYDPRLETTTRRTRTRRFHMLRELMQEQELKSQMREQHLMRRLHMPGEHTTKKRFDSLWPVEDSWRVGQYGDMGVYNSK